MGCDEGREKRSERRGISNDNTLFTLGTTPGIATDLDFLGHAEDAEAVEDDEERAHVGADPARNRSNSDDLGTHHIQFTAVEEPLDARLAVPGRGSARGREEG